MCLFFSRCNSNVCVSSVPPKGFLQRLPRLPALLDSLALPLHAVPTPRLSLSPRSRDSIAGWPAGTNALPVRFPCAPLPPAAPRLPLQPVSVRPAVSWPPGGSQSPPQVIPLPILTLVLQLTTTPPRDPKVYNKLCCWFLCVCSGFLLQGFSSGSVLTERQSHYEPKQGSCTDTRGR